MFTRFYISGKVVKLFNGRKSLKVLRTETFLTPGSNEIKLVTTTIKSNQFQKLLKYESFSMIKPIPIIFKILSNVNKMVKTASIIFKTWFLAVLFSLSS